MTTFGEMQTRIRRELNRDGLTAEIRHAIASAIEMHQEEDYWFLDGEISASASSSAQFIAVPTAMPDIDRIELSGGATLSEPLRKSHFNDIRNWLAGTVSYNEPTDWAIWNDRIYFYPPPDSNYKLRLFGKKRLTEVTASASANATNVWMTDGERLIRFSAKTDVYMNKLRNGEQAAAQEIQATQEKSKLLGKNVDRRNVGTVKRHL